MPAGFTPEATVAGNELSAARFAMIFDGIDPTRVRRLQVLFRHGGAITRDVGATAVLGTGGGCGSPLPAPARESLY